MRDVETLINATIPVVAYENAVLSVVEHGYDPNAFSVAFMAEESAWIIWFLLSPPSLSSGDIEVRVAKEGVEVLEIRRFTSFGDLGYPH
ncbi:MAG: hypothetical protein NTZ05_02005 [Chloroflexi bacterium]|nr:hypothetical protein [Chloroflexota bacterium]